MTRYQMGFETGKPSLKPACMAKSTDKNVILYHTNLHIYNNKVVAPIRQLWSRLLSVMIGASLALMHLHVVARSQRLLKPLLNVTELRGVAKPSESAAVKIVKNQNAVFLATKPLSYLARCCTQCQVPRRQGAHV